MADSELVEGILTDTLNPIQTPSLNIGTGRKMFLHFG